MSEQIGKCLCGGVRFRLAEAPREVVVCHCGICRRLSGGMPVAEVVTAPPVFDADETLKWHRSSAWGERGFCAKCGTNLFCRSPDADKEEEWGVLAGALENPPPLKIIRHIFIDDKPDFYDFADDAPRLTGEETYAEAAEMLRATKGDEAVERAVAMWKAAGVVK